MSPTGTLDREAVALIVKRVVVAESRLSIPAESIADDEPLVGEVLRVNSLGFVGVLVRIEDELDTCLPEDLFVGRSFHTVNDLIDTICGAEVVR